MPSRADYKRVSSEVARYLKPDLNAVTRLPAPQLEDPDWLVTSPFDRPALTSFGPIATTSRNLDVARSYDGGNGIISIDLSKVNSLQVEVWQTAPRVNGVRGLPYHRSIWAEEVTIFESIPQSAILEPIR